MWQQQQQRAEHEQISKHVTCNTSEIGMSKQDSIG